MNREEAILLCRYVRAACPQQAIDSYTPDAWADLLADLRYEDARDAVKLLAARQPFVAPSEIRAEVKRIRNDRITRADHPIPPADLDPAEAKRWLCDARRHIGDGNTDINGYGQLETRPIADLIAATARTLTDHTRATTPTGDPQ